MKRVAQAAIIALPVFVAVLIGRLAVDLPWWDEWEWADLIYKMHTGTLQFADVWAQHNEHRLFVANLLMLGLDKLAGWHQIIEQFVSLGILVLTQVIVVMLFLRTGSNATRSMVAAALASLFLYGLWQQENLAWGFQMAWFLCNFCCVAVVFLLARPRRLPVHVVLAGLAAVAGSLSSSQGLLAWAAGIVAIALTSGRRKETLAVWSAAGAATYFVYRNGMTSAQAGHLSVVAQPLTAVGYVLTYLGAPLVRWLGDPSCMIAGALLLAVLGAALVRDVRAPERSVCLSRHAAWYALAAYPVLCAIVTAAGRAAFGIDQALNSRYTTIASLAWVALIGLAAAESSLRVRALSGRRLAVAVIGTVAVAYAIVANNAHGLVEWKKSAATLAADRNELIRGDGAVLNAIYPYHARIVKLAGELRSIHDGPFNNP